ncbi:MAG: hypothetical protein AB8B70_11465, partial [Prochlorococcus sp.]
ETITEYLYLYLRKKTVASPLESGRTDAGLNQTGLDQALPSPLCRTETEEITPREGAPALAPTPTTL